jgi:amidase
LNRKVPLKEKSMNLAEYASYDGLGLAELVRSGQVSARELAELLLAAVERLNSRINAVLETYPERASALGPHAPDGPFAGVPFLLKDIGSGEAGQLQELGSRLARGRTLDADSFLVEAFRAAGLTLLGRTATPEFALSATTESVLTGATRNPWDTARLAGGSSGGAAASVAAGILPIAHASDGAGSIRIPASACGLVGLKPSRGRVSSGPHAAESLAGMSQEFVVCRTVRDAAAMLDAVARPMPGDPFVIVRQREPYTQQIGANVGPLRIAWTARSWQPGASVDPEIARCVEQAARQCEALGHAVEEDSPSFDYEAFLRAICIGWAFGFDVEADELAAAMGRAVDDTTLEPVTLAYYQFARGISAADVVWADRVANQLRRGAGRFFEAYDILITPTLMRLPEPIGRYSQSRGDLDFYGFFRLCDELCVHMPLFNLTGQPAISLPLGISSSGLPIGVQFAARFGREDVLLALASAFEAALPWRGRQPAVHVSTIV